MSKKEKLTEDQRTKAALALAEEFKKAIQAAPESTHKFRVIMSGKNTEGEEVGPIRPKSDASARFCCNEALDIAETIIPSHANSTEFMEIVGDALYQAADELNLIDRAPEFRGELKNIPESRIA